MSNATRPLPAPTPNLSPDAEPKPLISDADLDRLAAAELAFRRHWARELGTPGADLFELPPVAPRGAVPSNDV